MILDAKTLALAAFAVLGGVGLIQYIVQKAVDHAFARRQDVKRNEALQALEVMKTRLTFDEAVLRQVAGEKVARLLKLVAVLDETVTRIYSPKGPVELGEVTEYWSAYRAALLFLNGETRNAVDAFGRELAIANGAIWAAARSQHRTLPPDLHERAEKARDQLFVVLRRDLGLSDAVPADRAGEGTSRAGA